MEAWEVVKSGLVSDGVVKDVSKDKDPRKGMPALGFRERVLPDDNIAEVSGEHIIMVLLRKGEGAL